MRVQALALRLCRLEFRVEGLGFRVQGSMLKV
jgi:hypothetical protein